jgi:hypothetical protein
MRAVLVGLALLAGACGRIKPEVVTFSSEPSGCTSIDLATRGDTVYWTNEAQGHVRSLRDDGSGLGRTIASGEDRPRRVTLSGAGEVYWLAAGAHRIRHALANGVAETVVETQSDIGGFVLSADGASLYFSSDSTISRVPSAGGPPVVVAREEERALPRALALSGNVIAYPADGYGDVDAVTIVDGQVASCGGNDGHGNATYFNCTRLARDQGELALDLMVALPNLAVFADGAAVKLSSLVDDDTNFQILDDADGDITGLVDVTGLAARDSVIYFARANGVVAKVTAATKPTTTLITRGENAPRALALGDHRLYWSTADCTITSADR